MEIYDCEHPICKNKKKTCFKNPSQSEDIKDKNTKKFGVCTSNAK